jgi:hypothetical protein
MPTDSQISANRANSQHSTGPRTEQGKAASSRNALTHGLFTIRDFVQPEEEAEFDEMAAAYRAELNPQTILEQTYVAAIISATWRLYRCSKVEAGMSGFFGLDPMEDRVGLPIQTSVDRARSQSFNILRRSTAELRHLQTDRALRRQLAAAAPPAESETSAESDDDAAAVSKDLTSHKQLISSLAHAKRGKLLSFPLVERELASNCSQPAPLPSRPEESPLLPGKAA